MVRGRYHEYMLRERERETETETERERERHTDREIFDLKKTLFVNVHLYILQINPLKSHVFSITALTVLRKKKPNQCVSLGTTISLGSQVNCQSLYILEISLLRSHVFSTTVLITLRKQRVSLG